MMINFILLLIFNSDDYDLENAHLKVILLLNATMGGEKASHAGHLAPTSGTFTIFFPSQTT